jgi:PPOX class probable F420-dependent enzyme
MGLLDRAFDRMRHPAAHDVELATSGDLQALDSHRYGLLVTYRRNGEKVPTPVWFARDGDRLFIRTQADSAKVKRVEHIAEVLIAPCTPRGKPLGAARRARARVVRDPEEALRAERALAQKYRVARRLYHQLAGEGERVYLVLEAGV